MKSLGGNTKLMKKINRQLVLNAVYAKAPISSADIARLYRFQRSTVTNIVNELLTEGYLRVAGIGTSNKTGGKPPTLLELNAQFGYIIGIELLPAEIRMVLMNFKTEILLKKRYYFDEELNDETIITEIVQLTKTLIKEQQLAPSKILGLGLGISGLVNYSEGRVRYSIGLHLDNFPIVKKLEVFFDFPIYVDNDANAAVLAEKWLGAAKMNSNIVYMSVNEEVTGIGCGLMLENDLYRGITRSAGELPLKLPPMEELLNGMDSRAPKHNVSVPKISRNFNLLKSLCENPEALWAQKILVKLGSVLGAEMVRIIDFVNPEVVILGGEISNVGKHILKPILEIVDHGALKIPRQAVKIRITSFGAYTVAIGATALILTQILKPKTLKKTN